LDACKLEGLVKSAQKKFTLALDRKLSSEKLDLSALEIEHFIKTWDHGEKSAIKIGGKSFLAIKKKVYGGSGFTGKTSQGEGGKRISVSKGKG